MTIVMQMKGLRRNEDAMNTWAWLSINTGIIHSHHQ